MGKGLIVAAQPQYGRISSFFITFWMATDQLQTIHLIPDISCDKNNSLSRNIRGPKPFIIFLSRKPISLINLLSQGCPTGGPPVGFVRPARVPIGELTLQCIKFK
jgi:hypothetical protein